MVQKDDKLFEIDPRHVQGRPRPGRGDRGAVRGPRRAAREGIPSRQEPAGGRGRSARKSTTATRPTYEETEANLEVAKANRDLARLNLDWTEVRAPIVGAAQPADGRPRQPDQGRRHRADLDRQPGSDLRLLRRPRAGHAADQAADAGGQAQAQGPGRQGGSRRRSACPTRQDFPHQGIVDFTDNRVDLNTGTLRFRAKIDNPPDTRQPLHRAGPVCAGAAADRRAPPGAR